MWNDEVYMREAVNQAHAAFEKDEVPVGCVIVHNNNVVARAHNQVEALRDPTAHAEMIAITQATNTLTSKYLQDCTMYVTIEPCSMCAGALVLARMHRLCFGAYDSKAGACGSVLNIVQNYQLNHRIEVTAGILESECAYWMSEFFKRKRKHGQD